jgi:hypothetical protein
VARDAVPVRIGASVQRRSIRTRGLIVTEVAFNPRFSGQSMRLINREIVVMSSRLET